VPLAPFCLYCNVPLIFRREIAAEGVAGLVEALSEARSIESVSVESLTPVAIDVMTDMDPHLQKIVARVRRGIRKVPTSSTGENEVAVIAKVTDVSAWEGLSEVRVGAEIGSASDDGTTLVTARIPVTRVESVRQKRFVKSLKATRRLRPNLAKTTKETGARLDLLPSGNRTDGGRGAIVGIADFGFDFAHLNLRNSDGSTRALLIWDQGGQPGPNSPFGFGKLHKQTDIDAALKKSDPYQALGYGPPPDSVFQIGTHGTHVSDIAAGNGLGSKVPGVAPNADIIFVEVSASDIPFSGSEAVGKSFGDSVQLLEAIQFIFDQAANRPCSINVSLGTNGGPHDGSTLVEQGIDRLIRQAPNRAVTIAASNSFSDGIHATGNVPANGTFDLIWQIPSTDSTSNELEIWYSGSDRFAVEVLAPNGNSMVRVEPGETKGLKSDNRIVLLAANRLKDPNNGDNTIGIFLESGLPLGAWTIRLHGVSVQGGSFHAWIERDDEGQSNFAPPLDNSHTLGSISCGHETVVVGSYDAHKTTVPLSFFSSSGPTRDGRQKPEVSAPGHDVLAAHSRTKTGVTRKSGTSMAAPAVTGIIALMLAEASKRGVSLNATQIRNTLMQTARKNPPAGAIFDLRYGNGRISAKAAVAAVMALSPPAPLSAVAVGKEAASSKKATRLKGTRASKKDTNRITKSSRKQR
jgi:subtilisin family serine protease